MALDVYERGHVNRVEYWEHGVLKTTTVPQPAISAHVILEPDPNVRSPRRKKPSPSELVWSGTGYVKSMTRVSHNQVVRALRYPGNEEPMYITWASAKDVFGEDVGQWSTPWPQDPMNQLIGKVRADVVNFAEMLGEYKSTAELFSGYTARFVKSVKYLKHGRVDLAISALGRGVGQNVWNALGRTADPRKLYLRWQFGVATLIQDLQASYKEATAAIEAQDPVLRYSVRKTYFTNRNNTARVSTPFGDVLRTDVTIGRCIRQLTAYVEVDNDLLRSAANHGLTNLPSLGWELLPWSWFIDYFVDIGAALQALDISVGIRRSVVYETITSNEWRTLTGIFLSGDPRYNVGPKQVKVQKWKRREIRALSAVLPQWKPKPSAIHIANSIAALTQLKFR